MNNLIKISESQELEMELYTNKEGFNKIQEKFDIDIGFIFSSGYIKVSGGLKGPGLYDVNIQGAIIENIYLIRIEK
jgi:hypothetical protein